MAANADIEKTTTAGDRIYSEPDADPYESELGYIDDVHDYSTLGEEAIRQPCKEEVNVTTVVAKHDELHVTVSYSQLYEFPDIFVTPPQFRQCRAIF